MVSLKSIVTALVLALAASTADAKSKYKIRFVRYKGTKCHFRVDGLNKFDTLRAGKDCKNYHRGFESFMFSNDHYYEGESPKECFVQVFPEHHCEGEPVTFTAADDEDKCSNPNGKFKSVIVKCERQ